MDRPDQTRRTTAHDDLPEMDQTVPDVGMHLNRTVGRLPWADWSFWPWLRYKLTWHGWRAKMADNEPYQQQRGWKLHRCPDGRQCRAEIPGGCAGGWCCQYEVRPDEAFVPRFPRRRILPPITVINGHGNTKGTTHGNP